MQAMRSTLITILSKSDEIANEPHTGYRGIRLGKANFRAIELFEGEKAFWGLEPRDA